jgi:hypothetical protein
MKIMELGHFHHCFINYYITSEELASFIPKTYELDLFENRPVVSWVASTLQEVKVLGVPRTMNEMAFSLTLRTYVKKKWGTEWIKGILPLSSWMSGKKVSTAFRWLANYKSSPLKMERSIHFEPHEKSSRGIFEYRWPNVNGEGSNLLRLRTVGLPQPALAGYLEFFTTERYVQLDLDSQKSKGLRFQREPWYLWEIDDLVLPESWPGEVLPSLKTQKPIFSFVVKGSKTRVDRVEL